VRAAYLSACCGAIVAVSAIDGVRSTLKGIRRTKGTAATQKAPTLIADIRAMVAATDAGLIGIRDRALILLGFAGAFRRSELVSLNLEDCAFGKDGLVVTLRRSKTDQDGEGRKILPRVRSSVAVVGGRHPAVGTAAPAEFC
jgi:integrase